MSTSVELHNQVAPLLYDPLICKPCFSSDILMTKSSQWKLCHNYGKSFKIPLPDPNRIFHSIIPQMTENSKDPCSIVVPSFTVKKVALPYKLNITIHSNMHSDIETFLGRSEVPVTLLNSIIRSTSNTSEQYHLVTWNNRPFPSVTEFPKGWGKIPKDIYLYVYI